jgi:hypothetical protein
MFSGHMGILAGFQAFSRRKNMLWVLLSGVDYNPVLFHLRTLLNYGLPYVFLVGTFAFLVF